MGCRAHGQLYYLGRDKCDCLLNVLGDQVAQPQGSWNQKLPLNPEGGSVLSPSFP